MMETIVAVGNLLDGKIWTLPSPARHGHVLWAMDQVHPGRAIECYPQYQGFVTSEGRWVDRTEAASIAITAGQIKALKWPPYLYSEDLW